MEIRNRSRNHRSSSPPTSNAGSSPRKLFADNRPTGNHPYDELHYEYAEGATKNEHRTALLMAMADWIRNGSGAKDRLLLLTAMHEYENDDTDVVSFAIDVATRALTVPNFAPVCTVENIAAGFVTEERFVDPDVPDDGGVTLYELFWNWSPTEPLREAAPLSDTDATESVLTQEIQVSGPLWAWLSVVVVVVGYCWLVAMLVGGDGSRAH